MAAEHWIDDVGVGAMSPDEFMKFIAELTRPGRYDWPAAERAVERRDQAMRYRAASTGGAEELGDG